MYDLVFAQRQQLVCLERHGAACRLGTSTNQIQHSRLSGAIWPDDDPALVGLHIEAEGIDSLEPIKGNGEVFD